MVEVGVAVGVVVGVAAVVGVAVGVVVAAQEQQMTYRAKNWACAMCMLMVAVMALACARGGF